MSRTSRTSHRSLLRRARRLSCPSLWVPKTCATWADALRNVVGSVKRPASAGPVLAGPGWDDLWLVGLKLIFLVVSRGGDGSGALGEDERAELARLWREHGRAGDRACPSVRWPPGSRI
jgi:hypothetical protein